MQHAIIKLLKGNTATPKDTKTSREQVVKRGGMAKKLGEYLWNNGTGALVIVRQA